MGKLFWQRLLAYALIATFLLPLAATEWHSYALVQAASHSHALTGPEHGFLLLDGDNHEVHHCALCDLQISGSLLLGFQCPVSEVLSLPDHLILAPLCCYPAPYAYSKDSRGPPALA